MSEHRDPRHLEQTQARLRTWSFEMAKLTRSIPAPENWRDLLPHPLSQMTEFGVGIDIDSLGAHMADYGYDEDEPITLIWVEERKRFEELDGRHRHEGAVKAGVEPTFCEFIGKNPAAYVRKKLLRQHLDESQRAMLAAKSLNCANLHNPDMTQEKVAVALNVSRRSVASAVKVLANATPELRRAVELGRVRVSTAAAVASESEEIQKEVVGASGPVFCSECKNRKSKLRVCPACEEAQAKADKPKLKKKGNKNNSKKVYTWPDFDKAIVKINAVLATYKLPARLVEKVAELSAEVQEWRNKNEKSSTGERDRG
jgi:hypothetical protein